MVLFSYARDACANTMNIDQNLVTAFSACKYKAKLMMEAPSQDELRSDSSGEQYVGLLREEWFSSVPDGMTRFDGTISSLSEMPSSKRGIVGKIIVNHGDLSCHLDGLEMMRGRGKKALFSPVLISPFARPSQATKDVLTFAAFIIEKISGDKPKHGVLIAENSRKRVLVSLTSADIEKKQRVITEINNLSSTHKDSLFRLNRHCTECRFQPACRKKAIEIDHLSLLNSLPEKEIQRLNSRGIFTISQFSYTFRPRRMRRVAPTTRVNHSLKALAVRDGKTLIFERPDVPTGRTTIYLDVEGIPERRHYYLVGVLVVADSRREQLQFWADSEDDEKRIWVALSQLIEQSDDPIIFHHGKYDARFIKDMTERYGCKPHVRRIFESRLINTLSLIYGRIYFPTYGNGLKEVAHHFGFRWSDSEASGLQSINWRLLWELRRSVEFKSRLLKYNMEDCIALEVVTNMIRRVSSDQDSRPEDSLPVSEIKSQSTYKFGNSKFALPELDHINRCAYFDYQRKKIYLRGQLTKIRRKKLRRDEFRYEQVTYRINRKISIPAPKRCPKCGSTSLYGHAYMKKRVFDLKLSRYGVKRCVIEYETPRRRCRKCRNVFVSQRYLDIEWRYSRTFQVWFIYQNIALRQSLKQIREQLRVFFGYHVTSSSLNNIKVRLADQYEWTYKRLIQDLRRGDVLHCDETSVSIRGSSAYVWAFTNRSEVVYVYKPSRDGAILEEMLKTFRGVLVSDFYSAYEAVECRQQKCLIHLIRDMNDDFHKNQLDHEFAGMMKDFAVLLRGIVATIDAYGLKKRKFGKHRRQARSFLRAVEGASYQSTLANQYRKRFLKNRDTLFEFLNHDNVPWNNNPAENAVKSFADYRRLFDGRFTAAGIERHLILLSIYQSCKFKEIDFLKFLLSGSKKL